MFNIEHHLSRYSTDPSSFRSLQARTNTLISGSNALQFLDRTSHPEADLGLYTPPVHSAGVAHFLVEAVGYHYVLREGQQNDWKVATITDRELIARGVMMPSDSDHVYPTIAIRSEVWTFAFEKANGDQESLKVQIIVVEACSRAGVLSQYYPHDLPHALLKGTSAMVGVSITHLRRTTGCSSWHKCDGPPSSIPNDCHWIKREFRSGFP